MSAKPYFNQTVVANALVAIFERLNHIDDLLVQIAQGQQPVTKAESVLLERLERLTLKRHAVLTATLGGQSYQQLAKTMNCDLTTVKLHLRGALNVLGIKTRSVLLATKPSLLDFISAQEYERKFGIRKDWWMHQDAALMAVLQQTKPANNQHTRLPG